MPQDDHALKVDPTLVLRHELTRPLTYLVSCLDWVRSELSRPPRDAAFDPLRSWVAQACASAQHIADVVADAEPIDRPPLQASSELSSLVHATLKVLDGELTRRARLVLSLDEPVWVALDETRVRRLLLNLIVNAMVLLPVDETARCELSLTLATTASHAVFELRHDAALPFEAQLAHVSAPYFLTEGDGDGRGLHLGWAICKRIVHACAGSLVIERDGGRTRVRVALPLGEAQLR